MLGVLCVYDCDPSYHDMLCARPDRCESTIKTVIV
jgi:hypothetical protein